jgi:hypothetical protein
MHGKWVWSLAFTISLVLLVWYFAPRNPQTLVIAQPEPAGSIAPSAPPTPAKPLSASSSTPPTSPTTAGSPASTALPVMNPAEAIESVNRQMRPGAGATATPGAPADSAGKAKNAAPPPLELPEAESTPDNEESDVAMASGTRALPFDIGDSQLRVEQQAFPGTSSLVFFAPHDNENTCVQAALEVASHHGGRILELKSGGDRFTAFMLHGRTIRVDPNRIFTDTGIRKTLGSNDNDAVAAIAKFAGQLLKAMKANHSRLLVALHNNTNGQPLEISDFAPGRKRASEAADYHANPALDSDDFFLTTTRPIFEKLKQAGYNVVLQDNQRVPDDGSLSVYCGRHDIPYLNVEAENGHHAEQVRMIEAVVMMDGSKPIPPAGSRSNPSSQRPRPRIQTEERDSPEESPSPRVSPAGTKAGAF